MIYTGYFDEIETYKKRGLVPVCIAGKAPDWYDGVSYKKLAPKKDWWQKWHDEHLSNEWYNKQYYQTVLCKLDAQEVSRDLAEFGENVVLLCYEKSGEFCHRNIVSNWLNENGILSMEYDLKQTIVSSRYTQSSREPG